MMSEQSNSNNRDGREPGGQREQAAEPTGAVEEAIQTVCGALVALQASQASVETIPGGHHHAEASLRAAIDLVREAVADLRQLSTTSSSSEVALGFVVERPPS